jgi:hypothetical protein
MCRFVLLVALLAAGCNNIVGPFEHRKPERVDDPLLSIPEQEREGRARLPLPVESRAVGPDSGVELGGPLPH